MIAVRLYPSMEYRIDAVNSRLLRHTMEAKKYKSPRLIFFEYNATPSARELKIYMKVGKTRPWPMKREPGYATEGIQNPVVDRKLKASQPASHQQEQHHGRSNIRIPESESRVDSS